MITLKIAICDDDPQEHVHLNTLLQAYQAAKGNDLVSSSFYSGVDLLSELKDKAYDLILLDVVMPGFSGIQAAKEIRLFNQVIPILFLSSSPEFAIDSYAVDAYSYLLKPVHEKDLFPLLDKIYGEVHNQTTDGLVIKSREGIVRISFSAIEYVEVMNKRVSFHLTDGSVKDTAASLSEFEPQLLSRSDFLKVHRSFLINLRCVQTLNVKGIVTQMGHGVPISKVLYGQVKESYLKYLFVSQPKPLTAPAPQPAPSPPEAEPQPSTYRILLVDDELEQQNNWARILRSKGCEVDIAPTMAAAVQLASDRAYDCVVLDVMLSGESSFSHCTRLRELTNAPVVFLSALTDSDSQLQGFLSGGIDYITKDTPSNLFWAKIQTRIRLAATGKVHLSFPPLLLDLSLRKALVADAELMLTPTEFDLLWLLAEHAGRVYTPEELYRAIWGEGQCDGGQSIQVHMSRMRRKLEKACPSHYFIETAWGKGYRFTVNQEGDTQEDTQNETT